MDISTTFWIGIVQCFSQTRGLSFIISYIDILIQKQAADSSALKKMSSLSSEFLLLLNSFTSQLFLFWLMPSLRLSVPLEIYFITRGKQFHPLAPPHSPFDCRGATSCIFLSAGCKSQTKKHIFNLWKKGGVGSWAATAQRENAPKSASIVWHWRGRWRSKRSEQQG